ncbi:addiction module killer protein Doc (plasmid) [Rhizobium phaseoli]|uniref:type II toxin-antitoxin system death-on-curing family toxin n=1 Tax=Rhizobium phaseoli TaxID=396 RepID=UPI0007EA5B6D|nr:type II toxin-antitoxin system death-on-curing family toxin [Rhizobium phaseoli]ANL74303.1 addiction module killer protein Doc [Rhizobium phaseoli]
MTIEPLWVTADEVIRLNERMVAATGETHLLRDEAALEGALNRPQTYFHYEDIFEVHVLAAYLVLAVGKAHAFEQGNKRTAWVAARAFLRKNGYRYVQADVPQEVIGKTIYDLMADETLFDEFVALLDKCVEPVG